MGFLDDMAAKLGGKEGEEGGFASLQNMLTSHGGLQGLTSKLTNSGFGQQVQSWVGTGENQPISGHDVQQAMDPTELHQMAAQAGMSDEETSQHVAQVLPEMVSHATPEGQMPSSDPFAKGLESLKKMLKM